MKSQKKRSQFIEGLDTYEAETNRWINSNPVPYLVGIFVLPANEFYLTPREKLELVGRGSLQPIEYSSDVERGDDETGSPNGHGYTIAVNDGSRVRPVVFLREEIVVTPGEFETERREALRLQILLHELGHAQDIVDCHNFDHANRKLRLVEAETFAHRYALNKCRRYGYYLLQYQYLKELHAQADFKCPVVSASARAAISEVPEEELRRFAEPNGVPEDFLARVKRARRLSELR